VNFLTILAHGTCELHGSMLAVYTLGSVTWIDTAPSHETSKALGHGSQMVIPLTCGIVHLIAAYYSFIYPERMKG